MHPAENKVYQAEANHTKAALDEIMGNVDNGAKAAREATRKAALDVKDAHNAAGIGSGSKGPGFFSRLATGFRNFGNRISAFFGGKSAAAPAQAAPAMTPNARANDRSESMSEEDEMKNNLNVTYTRAQGRAAAAQLGADDAKLDLKDVRGKVPQASSHALDAEPEMADDVKQSLNVTMTRSEAMAAAKQLSRAASEEHAKDVKSPGLGL